MTNELGSSPLTRGKPPPPASPAAPPGLIPTHAEKTASLASSASSARAHPRSRGENTLLFSLPTQATGSSPLTRGKRSGQRSQGRDRGIIPAHAGKTWRLQPGRRVRWAHPHSRGENTARAIALSVPCGSSPLTRGKPDEAGDGGVVTGIIPAHAGKTLTRTTPGLMRWDHPRSRGENCKRCETTLRRLGSSPLTRGKQSHLANRANTRGIIPAHAGKTT